MIAKVDDVLNAGSKFDNLLRLGSLGEYEKVSVDRTGAVEDSGMSPLNVLSPRRRIDWSRSGNRDHSRRGTCRYDSTERKSTSLH
eukprot:scaffold4884_cov165-Amphora_coffeaeformis.AAC.2